MTFNPEAGKELALDIVDGSSTRLYFDLDDNSSVDTELGWVRTIRIGDIRRTLGRVGIRLEDLTDESLLHIVDGSFKASTIRFGELAIDPQVHTVTLNDSTRKLPNMQGKLLTHLAMHPKVGFTRTQLLTDVWGTEYCSLSTVNVHILRLRRTFDELGIDGRAVLANDKQLGYYFDPTPLIEG